jgi:biopolymer transport protein TolR
MPDLGGRHGSRRRTINQINMVPFIDVMLVLLIIFMVSAPLITTGLVDLPSVGATTRQKPPQAIEVVITKDQQVRIKVAQQEPVLVPVRDLASRVKRAQGGAVDAPVVIAADKDVRYEAVVDAMRALHDAGVARVGLAVQRR